MTPAKLSLNPPTGLSRPSRWRLPLSCARRGEFTTRGAGVARASGPEERQLQIGGLLHCPVSCHLIVVSEGGNVGIKKLQEQPNSSGEKEKEVEKLEKSVCTKLRKRQLSLQEVQTLYSLLIQMHVVAMCFGGMRILQKVIYFH